MLKGLQILDKEDKNMIKKLTYITKISKNNKENKSLLQSLMKNLKISLNEEQSSINFDEYFLMVFKFLKILNLRTLIQIALNYFGKLII